ncbi:MAG: DnaJ domain-containing protein [Blastocatellia bacterium]|nr:DnaJ domain-containing protein [Blastocatellia bacterium]
MNGLLNRIAFADVIRELHLTRRTGLLRLVQGKTLRAIFVEEGKLVFALSNLPSERLGDLLLRENRIAREQYDECLQDPNSKQRMGKVLVEKGILTNEEADFYTKKQITEIILTAFTWTEGEFAFEENTKAAHDVKLDLLTPNIILMGVRSYADELLIRNALGPTTQRIQMSVDAPLQMMQATLDGTEGFVLSRISDSLSIDELVLMCGVPEIMILRVVYALLCSGILVSDHPRPMMSGGVSNATGAFRAAPAAAQPARPTPKVGQTPASSPPVTPTGSQPKQSQTGSQPIQSTPPTGAQSIQAPPEVQEQTEQEARNEVRNFLYQYSQKSATYYSILGVDPSASDGDIKKAYYALAKKRHPDRFRQYGAADILTDAEQVFAKISDAYEKLKDPDTRKRYDDYIGVKSQPAPTPPPAPPATPASRPAAATPPPPPPQRPAPTAPPPQRPAVTQPPPRPVATPPPSVTQPRPVVPPPAPPVQPRPTPPAVSSPMGSTTQGFTAPQGGMTPPADASRVGFSTGSGTNEVGKATGNLGRTGNLNNTVGTPVNAANVGSVSGSSASSAPMSNLEIAQRNFQYGRAGLDRKDFLLAARYFREAVKYAPDNINYRMFLAQVCSQNPKLRKEAEESLLHVVKLDPKNIDALLMLGKIYKIGGLEKSAKIQYEAVLKLQPNHREALLGIGKDPDNPEPEPPKEQQPAATAKPAEKIPEKAKETGGFLSRFFKK